MAGGLVFVTSGPEKGVTKQMTKAINKSNKNETNEVRQNKPKTLL